MELKNKLLSFINEEKVKKVIKHPALWGVMAGLVLLIIIVIIATKSILKTKCKMKLVLFGMPECGKTRTFVYIASGDVVDTVKSVLPNEVVLKKAKKHTEITVYDIPSSSVVTPSNLSTSDPIIRRAFERVNRPSEATLVLFVSADKDQQSMKTCIENGVQLAALTNGTLVIAAPTAQAEVMASEVLMNLDQTCVVTIVNTKPTESKEAFDCRSIVSLVEP